MKTLNWYFKGMLCLVMGSQVMAAPPNNMPKGWLWYKEEAPLPPIQKKKENPVKAPSAMKPPVPQDDLSPEERTLKNIGKQFDRAKATAILNPTFENVARAQEVHDVILKKSEVFGKVWHRVSLMNPENAAPQYNVNPMHRKIWEKQREEKLALDLKTLAKSHGLFFVFKQGCPYCHQFAPYVKRFADMYGFEVKAISADGGSIKEFPNASLDNGVVALINPKGVYPALFLANPASNEIIPVSWGMTSLTQLHENFRMVIEMKGGQDVR